MRLIYTDLNGVQSDVSVGFQFDHDGEILEVTACPPPHKASSSGKVGAARCIEGGEMEYNIEYYASVYNMEWIEREDHGWVHPEVELSMVIDILKKMFDCDPSGRNLSDIVDDVRDMTIGEFGDNPEDAAFLVKWLDKQGDNNLPRMLKRQSS